MTMPAPTPDGDGISGTYVFTGERSRQGYRLNRFASSLANSENRKKFLGGDAAYMDGFGLTAQEQDMVRRRDWRAMVDHGGNIYLLLKIAATVGHTLLQMGAQMRGETLDQFMASRPGLAAQVHAPPSPATKEADH
jgi:protocatechuate 4,5-dioxygenase alpha subunit